MRVASRQVGTKRESERSKQQVKRVAGQVTALGTRGNGYAIFTNDLHCNRTLSSHYRIVKCVSFNNQFKLWFHFHCAGSVYSGEWADAISSQQVKDVPYASGHYQVSSQADIVKEEIEKGTVAKS